MKLKIRLNFDTIIDYIFVITLILNCRIMYIYLPSLRWIENALLVVLVGTMIVGSFHGLRVSARKFYYAFYLCLLLLLYFAVYLVVTRTGYGAILKIAVSLVAMMFFYKTSCNRRRLLSILQKYSTIITLITLLSLFFWLFGSCLDIIQPTGRVYSTWGSHYVYNYYYLYFDSRSTSTIAQMVGLSSFTRNSAIFSEIPMFAYHLMIAFGFELFILHDSDAELNKKNIFVLLCGILSSFSTTAYVAMAVAILLKLILSKHHDVIMKIIKLIVLPCILIVGGVIIVALAQDRLSTNSGSVRIDDFISGMKVWLDYPIFGAGYGSHEIYNYLAAERESAGNSNSISVILMYGGIWLFLLYVIPCASLIYKSIRKRKYQYIAFMISFLISFSLTVIPFQYLTIFIFIIMQDEFKNEDSRLESTYGSGLRNVRRDSKRKIRVTI